MTTLTHESATDGQVKQIARVAADATEKAVRDYANLSKEGAQRVHSNPEFSARVREATILALAELSVTDKYKDEEMESSYGYLSGYVRPASIEEQIAILRLHWPQLNPDAALKYYREVYQKLQFPGWVEGPFAIIRPGFFSDKYGEELEEVLKAIAKARDGKFYNYRDRLLAQNRLRQSERTIAKLRLLMEQQPGSDILITAAQFGMWHRGRSVRRAREVFTVTEYGSGAKDTGTMILTHPDRLQHKDDLWLDCPGDEFSSAAGGSFAHAPYFFFRGGEVRFDARDVSRADAHYGSVSASLPQ